MNEPVRFHRWTSTDLGDGSHDGTALRDGLLVLATPTGAREYDDPHDDAPASTWEEATWTSPETTPGFPVTDLVASWNARTPAGTWIEVAVTATTTTGERTPWYVLGRWAEGDDDIHPTSLPARRDEHAVAEFDQVVAVPGVWFGSFRVRVTLLRRTGVSAGPTVSLVGALASAVQLGGKVPRSPSGPAAGTVIDVPAYSQQLHRDTHPELDNGGQSWCSPTSTTMILAYWGLGPRPEDYAWVEADAADRVVVNAARRVFDQQYGGAGNWPFNTAYAARWGTEAFVTRLRSLSEAEQFIAAGVPLVVSVRFKEDELTGAGYGTAGHLLTVIGFDEDGNVVSNDPASHGLPSNGEVRTTYDREQFENAWIGPTGGIVYVIHPPAVPLPTPPAGRPNW